MTDEKLSGISDPKKWALKLLEKEKDHLRAAPLAFVLILVFGFSSGWFFTWQVVVTSKNASIETLQISDSAKKSRIEDLQKENDRLVKQNTDFKTAISEHAAPLKKRTKTLATQLSDFAKAHAKDGNLNVIQEVFSERFWDRVNKIIRELDEAGQQSETLRQTWVAFGTTPANIQTISDELVKLANNLHE